MVSLPSPSLFAQITGYPLHSVAASVATAILSEAFGFSSGRLFTPNELQLQLESSGQQQPWTGIWSHKARRSAHKFIFMLCVFDLQFHFLPWSVFALLRRSRLSLLIFNLNLHETMLPSRKHRTNHTLLAFASP